MDMKVEMQNQKILAEKLRVGYEIITHKPGVYMIAKEVDDKAHIITVKDGKASEETVIAIEDIPKMITNTIGAVQKAASQTMKRSL